MTTYTPKTEKQQAIEYARICQREQLLAHCEQLLIGLLALVAVCLLYGILGLSVWILGAVLTVAGLWGVDKWENRKDCTSI